MLFRSFKVITIATMGLATTGTWAAEREYKYYDVTFRDCSTDPTSEPRGLNDFGVLAGYYNTEECIYSHAYTWFNGIVTDLDDTYEDGIFSGAQGIARNGVVIGYGDPARALALLNGVGVPLPTPLGCENQYEPEDINDAGTMAVGECDRNGMGVFAPDVYWIEDGTSLALKVLPGLPGTAQGLAREVNDDGVVTGYFEVFGEPDRSFWWRDGTMTEILNDIGGLGVKAYAINNKWLVVGIADDPFGTSLPVSYDIRTGVTTLLGVGAAHDVNDRGAAIGDKIVDFTSEHGLLYENGEEINLHELILGNYLTKSTPNAINNYGWIVGYGNDDQGRMRGWLLVPIYPKGDYDGDEDVDLHDFGHFQRCFAAEPFQGPGGGLHVGCSVFDFDDDVDLDLTDYDAFQTAFTGAITSGW